MLMKPLEQAPACAHMLLKLFRFPRFSLTKCLRFRRIVVGNCDFFPYCMKRSDVNDGKVICVTSYYGKIYERKFRMIQYRPVKNNYFLLKNVLFSECGKNLQDNVNLKKVY